MPQQELLSKVIGTLDRCGVGYMVTGSIASSLQGAPRSTHDIDLVVDLDAADADVLLQAFPLPEFYLSEQAVREAIAAYTMFNLLDTLEGDKVDFWLLTDEPFDDSRFQRRQHVEAFGVKMYVSSPEDTVLAKLRWAAKSGGSEKQFVDALRVFEVQRAGLDMSYIGKWVETLRLEALWARLQAEAQTI